MVGGMSGGAVTWMLNAGSEALTEPSFTVIVMFEYVPTFVVAGVPLNWPVVALKFAQEGLLAIEKANVSPSESEAAG
jgi:hypothetical protein